MKLRGINFGPIYNAAGAQGFFGEGYSYHRWWKLAGLTFKNCGFVAKTVTLKPRKGNMPTKRDGITPAEFKPGCIIAKLRSGVVLNSVGLTNMGAEAALEQRRWQGRAGDPYFLSFMSVEPTPKERLDELLSFVSMLHARMVQFQTPFGLEINVSCPNTGLDPAELVREVRSSLDIAKALRIPLQVKFNATMPVEAVCEACDHQACDALTMSNTIPWGKLPDRIDWKGLFGTLESPLAHIGGGGLSGPPLLPIVCDWIHDARKASFTKSIWACGGIDSKDAVKKAYWAGASGVQIGTVAIMRPLRMRGIIRAAHELITEK